MDTLRRIGALALTSAALVATTVVAAPQAEAAGCGGAVCTFEHTHSRGAAPKGDDGVCGF